MAQQTYANQLAARFAALTLNDVDAGIAHGGEEAPHGLPRRRARRQPERKRRDRARASRKSTAAKPQARLIGDSARVDITAAAFANAISSH